MKASFAVLRKLSSRSPGWEIKFFGIFSGVALLLLFVPGAWADCTVVPYANDANTVLLDHFDSSTSASFNGSLSAADCNLTSPTQPSHAYGSGQSGLGNAITLTPPAAAGSMSYLRYPTQDILCLANGTIEFWVYPTAYGFELADQGQYYNACSGWTFRLGINANGYLTSADWDFSGCWSMTSGEVVPLNAWSHIAVSWGSTGAKLYLNGVQVGSHASTDYPAGGFGGYLMMPFGSPTSVKCSIDELRISNVQRTSFNLCGPPSAPSLALPVDSAGNIPVSTTLSWNAAAGADSYTLQVSDSSSFSSFAINRPGITAISSDVSGLANDTKYYWRVNAKNSGGTSAWSNVWSFTTSAPANCISAEYTSDSNTVLLDHFDSSTSASFNAYVAAPGCGSFAAATPAYAYITGQSGFGKAIAMSPPAGQPSGSASFLKYSTEDILCQANGTIEFWVYPTARGHNSLDLAGQGQYYNACQGWTFRMGIDTSGHLTSDDWDFTGSWSMTSSKVVPLNAWSRVAATWGSAGAKLYLNGEQVGSHSSTDHPAGGFGGYLMMCCGTNAGSGHVIDELRISNVQRTVFGACAPPVGVFPVHNVPGTSGFTAVWPNPMRNTLSINFNLCRPAKVAVEIYSCNGTLVKQLTNETRESGVHTLVWNGCDKTGRQAGAGVYFMRLTLGDQTYGKQIAIIK
jgi:hypothetical protein